MRNFILFLAFSAAAFGQCSSFAWNALTHQFNCAGSGAGVTSLAGTANQITASAATGAVVLSIPSAFTFPGSATVTSTFTVGTSLSVDGTTGIATSSKLGNVTLSGLSGLTALNAGVPVARTLQSSSGGAFSWTNGNGVSGNPTPTLTLPEEKYMVAGKCQAGAAGIAFSYGLSNAPTAVCVTGTNTQFAVAEFTATSQWVQDHFRLPSDQTGALDFFVRSRAVGITGNQVWALQTTCVANAETGDPAFNAAQNITIATAGTTLQFTSGSQSTVTQTGCSAGEDLFWKLTLDATTSTTGNIDLIEIGWTVRRAL